MNAHELGRRLGSIVVRRRPAPAPVKMCETCGAKPAEYPCMCEPVLCLECYEREVA